MGFQLAGVRVRIPEQDKILQALEWAVNEAPLIMISPKIASTIPQKDLDHYLSRLSPAVLIVPDVHGTAPMPDLSTRLRKALGVQE
jgi:vacuolar-type H+-ATPase subunit F/Vma7